ncbi:hypothetical protein [Bradyrhizobium sp. AZCC 2289]|uniref:hypothetical protein n=1 Tax=Bradyrhizobium sp. AZCC 2289 TaxID=3117026 RepID=UPI002FEFE944
MQRQNFSSRAQDRIPDHCANSQIVIRMSSSGKFPADEHDQFNIRNDGSRIWLVLKAAAVKQRAKSTSGY